MALAPVPRVIFPKQAPQRVPQAAMEAIAQGVLTLEGQCLRLEGFNGTSWLLVWPPEFAVGAEGDEILVLDRERKAVARVGDRVEMGGGELTEGKTGRRDEELGQALDVPEGHRRGPYWIVGETIRVAR